MKLLVSVVLFLAATAAQADIAQLIHCTTGHSQSGLPVFIGTYNYNGQQFKMMFKMVPGGYCPYTVEV